MSWRRASRGREGQKSRLAAGEMYRRQSEIGLARCTDRRCRIGGDRRDVPTGDGTGGVAVGGGCRSERARGPEAQTGKIKQRNGDLGFFFVYIPGICM